MSVGFHKFKNGKPTGTLQPARDASIYVYFIFLREARNRQGMPAYLNYSLNFPGLIYNAI